MSRFSPPSRGRRQITWVPSTAMPSVRLTLGFVTTCSSRTSSARMSVVGRSPRRPCANPSGHSTSPRVDAYGEKGACGVARLASLGERHRRIGTDRKQLLLTAEPGLPTPPARPAGIARRRRPPPSERSNGFSAGSAPRTERSGRGHRGYRFRGHSLDTPKNTPDTGGCKRIPPDDSGPQKPRKTALNR